MAFNPEAIGMEEDKFLDHVENKQESTDYLIRSMDYEKVKQEIEDTYIPEKAKERIMHEYDVVVVRDFNDMYHKSEEEREEENKFYSLFKPLMNAKKRPKNISDYVTQMRICISILEKIAEGNGIYEPRQFIHDFLAGKIFINGLELPKLRSGMKKLVNPDYLTEFIFSDRDPDELNPEPIKEIDETLTLEDLLTDDEIKAIDESKDDFKSSMMYFDDPDDQDGRNVALELSDKAYKKLAKKFPGVAKGIAQVTKYDKNQMKQREILNQDRYVYNLTEDDFKNIDKYDQNVLGYLNDDQQFEEPTIRPSDVLDEDKLNAYLYKVEKYIESTTYLARQGSAYTQDEIDKDNVIATLSQNGFDVKALWGIRNQEKERRRKAKEDEKKINNLKAKIVKLEKGDKKKYRHVGDNVYGVAKKEKKRKKKKNKNKSKDIIKYTTGVDPTQPFDMTW